MNEFLPLHSRNTFFPLFFLKFWNVIPDSELMLFSHSAGFLTPKILIYESCWQTSNWHQLTSSWLAKWYLKREVRSVLVFLVPGGSGRAARHQGKQTHWPLVLLLKHRIPWSQPRTLPQVQLLRSLKISPLKVVLSANPNPRALSLCKLTYWIPTPQCLVLITYWLLVHFIFCLKVFLHSHCFWYIGY